MAKMLRNRDGGRKVDRDRRDTLDSSRANRHARDPDHGGRRNDSRAERNPVGTIVRERGG
jgi:hypothetical protein